MSPPTASYLRLFIRGDDEDDDDEDDDEVHSFPHSLIFASWHAYGQDKLQINYESMHILKVT